MLRYTGKTISHLMNNLDYDTYNPDGTLPHRLDSKYLRCQRLLKVHSIVKYRLGLIITSNGELVEILPETRFTYK